MIYRISLLSNAFTHVVKTLIHKDKITYIDAYRQWCPSKKRSKLKGIPQFGYYEEKFMKRVMISKRHSSTALPLRPVIDWLVTLEVPDIPVIDVGFEVNNMFGDGRAMYVKMIHRPAKEEYLKRDVSYVMRHHINNLGFKAETLEVVGIYDVKDFKTNILDSMMEDKQKMVDVAKFIFNKKIDGHTIRCIRGYEVGEKRALILKEYEQI